MHDGLFESADRRLEGASISVSKFAAEVVARLVAREEAGGSEIRESLLSKFVVAVKSADPKALDGLRQEFRRARVTAAILADLYIPEAARRLGKQWDEDVATFSDVTIGVARLQATLRDIGTGWNADEVSRGREATMLLILPSGEQHTLGAMVVASWLRRQGISVCLRIAPSMSELLCLLATRRFDGAMISIACIEKLEVCAKLVKTLKEASGNTLPVAVGGVALDEMGERRDTLGADIVTNDLSVAIEALGFGRRTSATAG
jgi:MerR family transcriptional regulator, light-induced transcriptional regulator